MSTARPDLLRLVTAGSVDDGKSTLIGRLLYDSQAVMSDQLAEVAAASQRHGGDAIDLSLLTDGLRAEREQGITIDVAYRYFATPRRRFILADTPGHVQYTRNMVTGASTANASLVLVDAGKGVLEQTRRHAFIASLLQIPHLVFCVNKMDLVDWSERVYDEIVRDFSQFAGRIAVPDVVFIPMSALTGDNVVTGSARMPWYEGPPLLYHLEHVQVTADRNLLDARFSVQLVIRDPASGDRGYAGQMASGVLRPGDDVVVLPAGRRSRVAGIATYDGAHDEAQAPMSVTVALADDVDVSRGDIICRANNRPTVVRRLDAMVCWMADEPLTAGRRYLVKQTSRTVMAVVERVVYRVDVNTLHRDEDAHELALNDIGRVELRLASALAVDPYRLNGATGCFIVIDATTNATVAGGRAAYRLDGDNLRHGLNGDLGFDAPSRTENVRRTAHVAGLLADGGTVAIVSLVSPYAADRAAARAIHDELGVPFIEVFVDTPLAECERRDPKGLYAKARRGEIADFTGVSDPYEAPVAPEARITGREGPVAEQVRLVLAALERFAPRAI